MTTENKSTTQPEFRTLVDSLRWRAAHETDRVAFRFLSDGENETHRYTYGELDREARVIAAELQSKMQPGERVLLAYPPGTKFVAAFYGCLYAKVVAVPVSPPHNARAFGRLHAIIQDAGARVALTTSDVLAQVEAAALNSPEFKTLDWKATDVLAADLADRWREPGIKEEDVAFLQYTSGSTGKPKGVVVAHENLVINIRMMDLAFQNSKQTVAVNWLPAHHDMGLIGCILMPIFGGFLTVLMPPMAFLEKPLRWLRAVTKYRGTLITGPNFAYELCTRKVSPEVISTLDLSTLTLAVNAAEPVRAETIEKFTEKFKEAKFPPNASYPCYGLAEATLFVSGGHVSETLGIPLDRSALEEGKICLTKESANARTTVGCGTSAIGQVVSIVNPESLEECPKDEVGEIWISGPHIAKGYWNNELATESDFRAKVASRGNLNFLRTGDLGFLSNDAVFLTGRWKDLVIINGKNHYPQDIELTFEKSSPALRPGNTVAFAVDGASSEELVVVGEIDKGYLQEDLHKVAKTALAAIWDEHELGASSVVFLKPGTLPKTSSGKVQRRLTSDLLRKGTLDVLFQWQKERFAAVQNGAELTSIVEKLITWFSKSAEIPRDRIDPARALTEYKLDSIIAFELVSQIEEHYKFKVRPGLVTEYPTLNAVAAFIAKTVANKSSAN